VKPAQVKCYSGRGYEERPIFFTMEGVTYSIHSVEKEWREPGAKHFLVCTGDNKRVELCYNEQNHEWSVSDPGEKELG
jgi:hypothetical protein